MNTRRTVENSYTYVRTAIVLLLIGLGTAVIYQTARQDFHVLASVSAYYYTPAQAIFVGALIGYGACMIALVGRTPTEDVLLNLGGIFATVVAIVPTSRGADYETAVRACEISAGPLLTERASTDLDCPSIQALEEATRANVDNNMWALLIVGAIGLIATLLFIRRERGRGGTATTPWWGFFIAVLVFVTAATAFVAFRDAFIKTGHQVAAIGLFVTLLGVAVANALRARTATKPLTANRYGVVAAAMVIVFVVAVILLLAHVISVFWLEIAVFLLFIIFWMVQTFDEIPTEAGAAAT